MSDALPLPAHPDLEQYQRLAAELQVACRSADPQAIREWAVRSLGASDRLGERFAREFRKFQERDEDAARCTLSHAQFMVARCYGFAGWLEFTAHLESVSRTGSSVAAYEAAADAIVAGDAATLARLLHDHPELARARSTRQHRSTLLHYVSANGVEDFRQKTPPNIVAIAALLLDAGADVNAESDAYAGRSTTLGLTATSYHPEAAGVQLPLLELLIRRGAVIDGPDTGSAVIGCFHNGRGDAAEFFASAGARLDFEAACGVGRIDLVRDALGSQTVSEKQLLDGLKWACEFGRTQVVEFLLDHGVPPGALLADGETGLHWTAYEAHVDTTRLLLARDAPVDAIDATYHGTPLGWAIYAWGNASKDRPWYDVVALLARAGATFDPAWLDCDDDERRRAAARLATDPRMQSALTRPRP